MWISPEFKVYFALFSYKLFGVFVAFQLVFLRYFSWYFCGISVGVFALFPIKSYLLICSSLCVYSWNQPMSVGTHFVKNRQECSQLHKIDYFCKQNTNVKPLKTKIKENYEANSFPACCRYG